MTTVVVELFEGVAYRTVKMAHFLQAGDFFKPGILVFARLESLEVKLVHLMYLVRNLFLIIAEYAV